MGSGPKGGHFPTGGIRPYRDPMIFFSIPWLLTIVGFAIHAGIDKSPQRRTGVRLVELALLWLLVVGGVWALLAALGHLGPNSDEIADGIGYAPSMFQWEVGWADAAIGVLGIGCLWMRDQWMTAAVVTLSICYLGDAIGHIMQYTAHDNTATNNVGAIPSDILGPVLAIGLLIALRAMQRRGASAVSQSASV